MDVQPTEFPHEEQDRIAHLRARLDARDVTANEVREFIWLNHKPAHGQVQQDLASFVRDQDIAAFWWLHDWWAPVSDKPKVLPTPQLHQFCWSANYVWGASHSTMDMAMRTFYEKCVAHCNENKLPLDNPGESAEDRKLRRNRERMAAVRQHRRVPGNAVHDDALLARVRLMEADIEAMKAQAKAVDEQLKEEVRRHQEAMNTTAQYRKTVALEAKERIDEARAAIKMLTAKQ
jgi:hypothetical protein